MYSIETDLYQCDFVDLKKNGTKPTKFTEICGAVKDVEIHFAQNASKINLERITTIE